ncbi:unnamed protein product [Laminaria digitata]
MHLTPHGTRQHLTALRAWCKRCLPGRWKPDVLRPGIAGVRGSRVIRLRPSMILSTPGHCRDARVYGHTTTAMHGNEYTPIMWGCKGLLVIRLRPSMILSTPRGLWSYDYGHS